MPIPLLTADSPNMRCPHGGVVVLPSSIGGLCKVKGISVVDVPYERWVVVGCSGFPSQAPMHQRQFCTQVVNPSDCKADSFKVLGKYVADAEKVNKLKSDKGFAISLPSPIAKPYVKR